MKVKPDVRPIGVKTPRGIKGYWLCNDCIKAVQTVYTPWLEDAKAGKS
jgi:hypothetical protein